jgi:tetratricopeptide (TPR) repeat protein
MSPAERLLEVGRYEEAERSVRAELASSPSDATLLALLASILRARRDYPAALAAASAAVAADPQRLGGHIERAESLILLIRAREAVEAATAAVTLDPAWPGGHVVLARALVAARSLPRARVAARRGLTLAPSSVSALLTVADVERAAGHREAAVSAAQTALALAPDNAYGRWLLAMLDAERLRVRRSMRGLREVARDSPATPDIIAMTWPIRGVLSGLRRGLAVGAVAVCVLLAVGHWWWPPVDTFARYVSAVLAAVMIGFAVRVLVPAGRLPWRCLRLLPRLMRRASVLSLALVGVAVGALIAHATTGWWVWAVVALAAVPLLWALGLVELVGVGLDDPGMRHALSGLASELREWWSTTKRELRESWSSNKPNGK